MQKIVIDTNVIVSAALTPGGNASKIIKSVYEGKAQAFYNNEILDEYSRVLAYERLNISTDKQKAVNRKIVYKSVNTQTRYKTSYNC